MVGGLTKVGSSISIRPVKLDEGNRLLMTIRLLVTVYVTPVTMTPSKEALVTPVVGRFPAVIEAG